jgi:hypothetical protein
MLRIQNPLSDGLRLGELLIGAGVVTREAVESALTMAGASRLPLGRVLVSTGHLKDNQVDRFVAVQRRARAGGLCVADARRIVQELAWGAEHLLANHTHNQVDESEREPDSILLSLLSKAGVLTKQEIPYVMRSSVEADVTCGRLLLLRRRIAPAFHRHCINLLVQYRQGKISFVKATDECRRIYQGGVYVDNGEARSRNDGSIKQMGQLLVTAGFIDETELYDALEISLSMNRKLGDVLVEAGLVMQEAIEICVAMVKRIGAGEVAAIDAANYLRNRFVPAFGQV